MTVIRWTSRTGGTGKTGLPLARLLSSQSTFTTLLASRKGTIPEDLSGPDNKVHGIKFDWLDRNTWIDPFNYTKSVELSDIDRIYLVAPSVWDVGFMNDFIDFAREKGVNRFVQLSASQSESGGVSLGEVHGHLEKLGREKGVEWTVLRPTWFIENIGEYQVSTIRDEDTIYSIWEDGKAPFVSVEDIAAAAFRALVSIPSPNTDWIIHGPELFSNDQIAALLSTVLQRTITHTRITVEQYLKFWDDFGYPELAKGLVEGELKVSRGEEEAIFGREGAIVGKRTMRNYIEENKGLLVKVTPASEGAE